MRPTVIEDVFTLRMRFRIERCDANHRIPNGSRQVLRLPAGALPHAAGLFQRGQKAIGRERIARACAICRLGTGAGIPDFLSNVGQPLHNADFDALFCHGLYFGTMPPSTRRIDDRTRLNPFSSCPALSVVRTGGFNPQRAATDSSAGGRKPSNVMLSTAARAIDASCGLRTVQHET